jgi:hypothetical protein
MKYIKPFNEDITSFNFEEELQEFCEMNLAYLIDEELNISITLVRGGLGLSFKLTLELNENPRLWSDIKDHMIPFLTRLSNQYELKQYARQMGHTHKNKKDVKIEVTRDLEAARNRSPHRKTELYYQVNKLINDDIKSGLYYDMSTYYNTTDNDDVLKSYITEFEFIIDGYKQEKKSILTKLKSFFK